MDFVLWCIRTEVNNPCTSDKRADLLENVDWYNTYRRRVSTENNWRYGRCKTTHIDMIPDKDEVRYITEAGYNSSTIVFQTRLDGTARSRRYHAFEYLPHSNLRSCNNTVYNSAFSTSPNILSLDSGSGALCTHVLGDHYVAVFPDVFKDDTDINVRILTRKHGDIFTTLDVPVPYEVKAIEGKWALLVHESHVASKGSRIFNVMVFDIDNSIMCPGSIGDTWNATRFYKTTDNTAIVYTARVAKDDTDRIEWALYQFSSNNPVVQLRNGWFHLPESTTNVPIYLAHNSYDSHMIIELYGNPDYRPYIIHSVASNGQSHTPRNCYTMTDQHMPTPLLRAGYTHLVYGSRPAKVWTDLSYNDDQVLQIQGTISIKHIIGDIYVFDVEDHNGGYSKLLVDISTKEIIRKSEAPNRDRQADYYAMLGMLCSPDDRQALVIEEYGEL